MSIQTYDAGLLGDGGGGDVAWWQDYLRAELSRAHDHYQALFDDLSGPTIIRLGLGEVVVDTGTYRDIPAVFIEPANAFGPIGERAPLTDPHSVDPRGTIIELHGDPRVLIEAIAKATPSDTHEVG